MNEAKTLANNLKFSYTRKIRGFFFIIFTFVKDKGKRAK